ncbi:phage tail tape measure protein [Vreelandella venusta]|uniref:Phage tail tape measure protein n=1 Tax=Vreelandella venusta TaxID=44935 RepID=A0ABX2B812_9GAMM|nr:phage tail tape measure protein [Halomonas venusta]AZM95142.1 phage tail tape measure protein [Halomonas venusta]NPT29653.1 phage tail tape measure protein [Halomonas venusta]
MAQNLRLQVMLNAVDRVTGPLKRIRQGAGQTGQAMRETRDRLKELQRTQSDLTSYRKANAALRTTTRAMRDARARNQQYTQALEQQREAHASIKSGLTVARREYDRLAREMLNTKQPSDQLSASLERARVRLHGQQTEFDRSARAMREYRNRTRNADEEVKKLTRNHATQTERIRGLKTRLDEAGISTDNLGRSSRELRTKEERLNATLQEQKRHLSEVAERQRRLTQARDRYQNGMANVARAQGVGMGMFGTGIAQGYAASRLLTPGVAWGEQMSTLQAVGRFSADDERYQALREQSRELGGSTAFSATEVGGGQEFLLRAGMSAEAIQASMRDVLDLALANNTELARAADIASNIAGTFKIDMEADGAMARVADILSGTASRANVNLEMLGETMKYLGGSEDLDLTMEQAAAMAGLMGNIGIQGSMAGTAMRAMANRLTDPAKAGRDAMEQLGLQVSDANGNMRDMPDILRDINNATRDLGNVERRALLSKIFGAEAGSGMTELVNGMADGDLDELINALQTNAGENAEMARVMADNLGGDLKSLRSAWEEVGISITDTNDGPLRELVQTITTITRGVGEWIKANPELAGTIAKVAAGMIALATVGGAVTMTFASILSPLLFAKFAMTTLGIKVGGLGTALGWIAKTAIPWVAGALKGLLVAMGPIGWGIAAIAGAAFLIYKFWEPIKGFFLGLWQQVKDAFGDGIDGVARLLINWSPLGLIHSAFIGALGLLGISVPEGFRNLGGFVIDGLLSGMGAKLTALREWVTGMANSVANWFKEVLGIHSPSRVFEGFGINIVEGMINGIASMAGALRDQVMGMAANIAGWVQEAMASAWDSIGDGASRAMQWGRDTAAGMGQGIRDGASRATESAANLASGVTDTVRGWLDIHSPSRVFATIGGYISQGLANGIENDADSPVKQVRSVASRMCDAAAGLMLSAGIASPAVAIEAQPPELPQLPGLHTQIERPEQPTLQALQIEHPTLPELSAPELQRPELPQMPRLMSEVATPETPTLDALRIERPTLPELPSLDALQIQQPERPEIPTLYSEVATPEAPTLDAMRIERPELPALPKLDVLEISAPDLPRLYSEVATPETPTLDALRIERPTLPALPSLGALQIQQPALPEMPRLMSEVATPEIPTLDALRIEQPKLPALPSLGALEIQQPALPEIPTLYSEVTTPEIPTLDALRIEQPALPELGALEIHVPEIPRLMSEVATPEIPTLDALRIEQPTLPALPSLGALQIQQPTLPEMPRLMSEVATPEIPTLNALHIERPELPALPELGALEISVPEMPRLISEVTTPEIPTLDALRIEQPKLPALPSLGALEIPQPALPEIPTLYSEVTTPETPTLDALHIEQPTLPVLPELGALEISVPEMPRLISEVATPEIPTLDALRIEQPTLPALPSLGALQIQRPELPSLDTLAFEWPELPQFDPLRIDTSGVQIDARPPLQSHTSQPSSGLVINGGINIEINAAPGMNEQDLARLVNAEVQRALRDAERRAQASRRSAFHDID